MTSGGSQLVMPEDVIDASEWHVLSPDQLASLFDKTHCRYYEPGEMVFCEGDANRGVHFIGVGLVGVRREDANGNSVLMRLAAESDTLGYRSFLTNGPYQASAEVLQPSKICFFSKAVLHELLHDNPEFGLEIMRRALRDLANVERRLHQTITWSVRARFAHLLLVMRERYGRAGENGGIQLEFPITRSDMASMIGVRPESLSRIIRQMSEEGLLSVSGRHAVVPDVERLTEEVSLSSNHSG